MKQLRVAAVSPVNLLSTGNHGGGALPREPWPHQNFGCGAPYASNCLIHSNSTDHVSMYGSISAFLWRYEPVQRTGKSDYWITIFSLAYKVDCSEIPIVLTVYRKILLYKKSTGKHRLWNGGLQSNGNTTWNSESEELVSKSNYTVNVADFVVALFGPCT